jgi:hypothetical protein
MTKSIIPFTEVDDRIIEKAARKRESIAEHYPLTFGIIGTFGVVSILYSFEKIIDKVPLLANNPWILLTVGMATLLITGLALRKLG